MPGRQAEVSCQERALITRFGLHMRETPAKFELREETKKEPFLNSSMGKDSVWMGRLLY